MTYLFSILPMKEAKNDFKWLWNAYKEKLPELNDEQIRICIEIVADTCSSCHEDYGGCQCWNDE